MKIVSPGSVEILLLFQTHGGVKKIMSGFEGCYGRETAAIPVLTGLRENINLYFERNLVTTITTHGRTG